MSGESIRCTGCETPASPEGPQPNACQSCPPRVCDSCGELDHVKDPCPCWKPASEHIAAIKAEFAAEGVDIGVLVLFGQEGRNDG